MTGPRVMREQLEKDCVRIRELENELELLRAKYAKAAKERDELRRQVYDLEKENRDLHGIMSRL